VCVCVACACAWLCCVCVCVCVCARVLCFSMPPSPSSFASCSVALFLWNVKSHWPSHAAYAHSSNCRSSPRHPADCESVRDIERKRERKRKGEREKRKEGERERERRKRRAVRRGATRETAMVRDELCSSVGSLVARAERSGVEQRASKAHTAPCTTVLFCTHARPLARLLARSLAHPQ